MLIQLPASPGLVSATVGRWLKKVGEGVAQGEALVDLETEDGLVRLKAGSAGVLTKVLVGAGKTVAVGAELAEMEIGGVVAAKVAAPVAVVLNSKEVGMSDGVPIMMPQAGNSMEEGTVLKWRVKVGDEIKVGQVICEVETDKATVEVEATAGGRVSWLAAEGAVVAVKMPIAMLGGVAGGASAPVVAAPVAAAGAKKEEGLPKGVVAVLMPQAGNSMEEGTILKWKVKVGDRVTVGQILCDIETDKATVEMEATDAGRVAKIVAAEGAVVAVKMPIAYLAESEAEVAGIGGEARSRNQEPRSAMTAATIEVSQAGAISVREPHAVARTEGGRVKASPAARKLAAERGIDLASVAMGSGPEGRILSTDLAKLKGGEKSVVTSVATAAPVARTAAAAKGAAGKEVNPVAAAGPMAGLTSGRKALSKMRKAIAVNLQISKQTVPHFYLRGTINADPVFAFYRAQKPATGCTLNDVILLAVGRVVGEFGAFRSRIEGNEVVEGGAANIGVAVSVPDGLVVPVVMGVHGLTLSQVAAESKRVVESARNGKVENMGKGVFTISNMGMLGVEEFAAIINPPESGILAVSAVREDVIVKDGAMRAGRVMTMTLSVDHRVVDGALAAKFMKRLKELLEVPERLLG